MAEVIGPLDPQADCEFWMEKKHGTQGTIPIRWIVTKDVPFARFQDLKYHEQHVTQVRHGNTIPGEVGRLVIQRYFEAAHGSTAVLHPLSQIAHDVAGLRARHSHLPLEGQMRGWNALGNRHEASRDSVPQFQHGRNGFRCGFRRGSSGRRSQNGLPHPMNNAPRILSSNFGQLPQPVPGSFHNPGRRRGAPTNARSLFRGGLNSVFEESSHSSPRVFVSTAPPNGPSSHPEQRVFQQQIGPPQ